MATQQVDFKLADFLLVHTVAPTSLRAFCTKSLEALIGPAMTSFIIKSHVDRAQVTPTEWTDDPSCAFCRIIQNEIPSSTVYENDKVIAILDILPLREGHTLVIPKAHISRLSDLPPELAAATGEAVSRVARALTQALGNTALNVVCNQEYAQAVPHVHFHIIPAPTFGSASVKSTEIEHKPPPTLREMHQKEFEAREELDDDDAVVLLKKIKAQL